MVLEILTHSFFQHYWWLLISVVGSLLVFMLFVPGGQTLIYTVARNEAERSLVVNSLGRKWELTFTTLVLFGGAVFAAFPKLYATSFGGAYWLWIIILFSFTMQAVAYEYRTKPKNLLGQRTFEVFLVLNGLVGTFSIGVAVASFFTGNDFVITQLGTVLWQNSLRGIEAYASFQNLSLGLALLFLSRTLGLLYFMNNIDNELIVQRSRKQLWWNGIPFVLFFLIFIIWTFLSAGYGIVDGQVQKVAYKYLLNLVQMPYIGILFLAGVVLTLWGIGRNMFFQIKPEKGIWFAGFGVVIVVATLLMSLGFNGTAIYPSKFDLQSSLTIFNSSSSKYTLIVMSVVSVLVPAVIAYIWYTWRSMNKQKISQQEIEHPESQAY